MFEFVQLIHPLPSFLRSNTYELRYFNIQDEGEDEEEDA